MKRGGGHLRQLKNRDFRRYFVGEAISSVGDAMTDITIVMLAISLVSADDRPFGIAVASAAYAVPGMISGIVMARWVGGLSGRTMLLVDNLWRGALLGVVALLAMASSLSFTGCVILLVLASVTRPLNSAGARAIVVELTPAEELFAANSLVGLAVQSASLVGPVAAGFLVAWCGPGPALGVDALSFVLFAATLLLLPRVRAAASASGAEPAEVVRKERAWGVVRLLRLRSIGTLFGLTGVFYFLYGPFVVGLPLLVEERQPGLETSVALGILWGAFGVGAVVGGVVAGRIAALARVRIAALSAAGWGAAMFVVALPAQWYVGLLAMFLGGLAYAPYGPIVSTVMQRELPPERLNEASSYYGSMTGVASPLGTLAGGAAVGLLGAQSSVLSVGAVLAVGGVVVFVLSAGPTRRVPAVSTYGSATGVTWHDRRMDFRYATEADVPDMAGLFAANHRDALTERQRAEQGFVQGAFGEAELTAMVRGRQMLVAGEGGRVAGLLALCVPQDVPAPPPALRGLIEAQGALRWRGRPLGEVRWLLYGPVVVGAGHRGRGVARGLFELAVGEAAGRADAVVAFIESGNLPSWRVHVDGFGMVPLGEYTAAGRTYSAVAAAA